MTALRRSIEQQWYGRPHWLLLLAPLTLVFAAVTALRRRLLSRSAHRVAVPIVVVGNITVGGTGKTPVIIALVKALVAAGYSPGVIARGYGAELAESRILPVDAQPSEYGDEPVLVHRATGCSVAVGPRRDESAELLRSRCGCDVILSDDGLQHYSLQRDVEIAVIDGRRRLGNGWRLPVGPLREGKRRLREVDFVLINGCQSVEQAPQHRSYNFNLQAMTWRNVLTDEPVALESLPLDGAVAVAGIGNPQRFFDTLRQLGFTGRCEAFADHHAFSEGDFAKLAGAPVLMTEKDAVKCVPFAGTQWWALSVEAALPHNFVAHLLESLINLKPKN